MNKVKEYKLVTDNCEYSLTKTVNKLLEDGWELYGNSICSMAGAEYTFRTTYGQAMIKSVMTEQTQK